MNIISKDDLQKLLHNFNNSDVVILDVRNKNELHHGIILHSKNLPLNELEESLQLSDDIFQQKYGFSKPSNTQTIISYCRTGARSEKATSILQSVGFDKAINYKGSFADWFGYVY